MRSLEQFVASSQALAESKDWQAESLASLITHIHDKHHVFTREELDRIEPLLAKVCSVYSEKRPELLQIQALFERVEARVAPPYEERRKYPLPLHNTDGDGHKRGPGRACGDVRHGAQPCADDDERARWGRGCVTQNSAVEQ